jgi:hypothetical protein
VENGLSISRAHTASGQQQCLQASDPGNKPCGVVHRDEFMAQKYFYGHKRFICFCKKSQDWRVYFSVCPRAFRGRENYSLQRIAGSDRVIYKNRYRVFG